MPVTPTNSQKRLYYISPENLNRLKKRAPRTGHQGGGSPNINLPLNAVIQRYDALMTPAARRVWSALSEEQDRAFVRFALSSVAFDDLTLAEDPTVYLREIEEAMMEYDEGEEPFTPNLKIALRGFGALEAVALVDSIEQERVNS